MQLHLWGGMAPSSEVGNAVANMRGWALASTRPPLLEHRNVPPRHDRAEYLTEDANLGNSSRFVSEQRGFYLLPSSNWRCTFCWLDRQDGCVACSSCWIGP